MLPDKAANTRLDLMQLIFGSMAAQVVGSCVRLGVADALDAERSAEEVAAACGTPVGTTRRLLRAATALGLAVQRGGDRFALTPMGSLLRSADEGSLHTFARVFTDPLMVRPWCRLDEAVTDERTTFEDEFGVPFFEHLKAAPELAAGFNAAMSQGTYVTAGVLPDAYDFGRFDVVADLGGGDGTLLAAVLRRYEGLRGVLFDTAEGLAQADGTLRAAGVASRCTTRVGDFFTGAPEGVDAILLKSVLHDWDDDRCTTILGHCRRVLPADGRLLVVEPVLPEAVEDSVSPVIYLSDLNMLVNVGGMERTRDEFDTLLGRSGFTVTDVTPLPPSGFCLVEAVVS